MNGIEFEFEWLAPQSARGEELRATRARLAMRVCGEVVTRVEDDQTDTFRDGVYLPLYPLAEWLASNWWFLFHEIGHPGKSDYRKRHSLCYAREGYALPNLLLQPYGSVVEIHWSPIRYAYSKLAFLPRGMKTVTTETLQADLTQFIEAVLHRLESQGVVDTPLAQEWSEIQRLDPDEVDFCQAAATLGLDPFSLDDAFQNILVEAGNKIPKELLLDFCTTTLPQSFRSDLDWLMNTIEKIRPQVWRKDTLPRMRGKPLRIPGTEAPWDSGYQLAREVREMFGIRDTVHAFRSLTDILETLGVGLDGDRQSITIEGMPIANLKGIAGADAEGNAKFAFPPVSEPSRKFLFCRGLAEYLTTSGAGTLLITEASSQRQRINRAFAAEFLAPAEDLGSRIQGRTVTETWIEALAEEFFVSPYLIEHQITNHKLAPISRI